MEKPMKNYPVLAQKLFRKQIIFAAIMSVLALIMGLVYREVSRVFFEKLTMEQQLVYGHDMSLVHGHTFLLGAVIPLVLAGFTLIVLPMLTEKRLKNMNIRFTAYMVAASVALALMVYKGLAFIMGAGLPLETIDAGLFWGDRVLRGILFGLSHVTIFWSVGEMMAGLALSTRVKTGK
jgi:hypothetical protein